jgi:hypothetical protein
MSKPADEIDKTPECAYCARWQGVAEAARIDGLDFANREIQEVALHKVRSCVKRGHGEPPARPGARPAAG